MSRIEAFYDAAAAAGLLTPARVDGVSVMVDFQAPDESVLDGLGVSRQHSIRYAMSRLPLLAAGSTVEIAGIAYRVREVTQLGDGSEARASLTRL